MNPMPHSCNGLPFRLTLLVLLLASCSGEDGVGPDLTTTETLAPVANVRPIILDVPADDPGPPFYANFDATTIITDDGTVGILFLRDPACVPAGFNLLDGFDAPAAFGCALTVEGRLWFDGTGADPIPYQIKQWGDAVPVYFVDRDELDAAAQDGDFTIAELEGLPSLLVGSADHYREVVHNSNHGSGFGHSVMNARGTLEDGRSFWFHYNERFNPETGVRTFHTIQIDIGT